uniref:TFIIE domain-containing protein n=1 Tax=Heterorhabditis bacteriophora TaxID=37862 RepID=A0A1I7WCY5_HETBA
MNIKALLAGLKAEKLVKERLLQQKNENGRSVSIIFYFINYRAIINVLKYKIDHMRQRLEAREKEDVQKANYKCDGCGSQYDVGFRLLFRHVSFSFLFLEPQQQLLDFSSSGVGGVRAGLGGIAHSYASATINYVNADQISVNLNADSNSKPVEEKKVVPMWLQDDAIGGGEHEQAVLALGTESQNQSVQKRKRMKISIYMKRVMGMKKNMKQLKCRAKRSIKLCHNRFKPMFNATIGVDFTVKTIYLKERIIALQLWDTAGQERTISSN